MGILNWDRLKGNFKTMCRTRRKRGSTNKSPRTDREAPKISQSKMYGFFDGSACEWPPAGAGGFAIFKGITEICARAIHAPFRTSNWGKANALARLIEHGRKLGIDKMTVFGDSQIVINMINHRNSFRDWTAGLWEQIHQGVPEKWTFHHVGREYNKRADVIANAAAYSQ